MRSHLSNTRGQAASEYVALIALVALALTLVAGLTSGGVGGALLAGVRRGLCTVTRQACPPPAPPAPDLAPCPLGGRDRTEQLGATLGFVRLGSTGTLSAARASDGTVAVTLAKGSTVGGELGAGVRLGLGRRTLGGSGRAALAATWTSGRSWTLPSAAAARRFVAAFGAKATIGGWLVDEVRSRCSLLCDALGWRPHPQLPPPDAVYEEGGAVATLAASLGVAAHAGAGLSAAAVLGRRVQRDGATTWYLKLDGGVTARLGLPAAQLAGAAKAGGVVSYALDARGRPQTLEVRLTGEASASAAGAALVELDATLDLHDPADRAVAAALLAALRDPAAPATLASRARALGARILRDGQLDLRRYAVRDSASDVGATLALGIEIGGAFDRTTRDLRLVDAKTRLPGLPFLPRDDCRPA